MKKTAYVIGCGPSLQQIDMEKLRNLDTISFNRAYIAFPDWGFVPRFFLMIDMRVLRHIKDDVNAMIRDSGIERFFLRAGSYRDFITREHIQKTDKVTFFETRKAWGMGESWDDLVYCGDVAAASIQILYLLGFEKAVLLGIDQNWKPRKGLKKDGDHYFSQADQDTNHFRPDYYGKGMEYSNPYGDAHLRSWMETIKAAKGKIELVSGSPGSKLNDWLPYTGEFEQGQ